MNNEIKEILDKLKDGNWYDELDLTGTMWIELKWEETHLLLDYITNLQQENEDNLKCIKNLKEQLESVIKNNQELLEKWHKNNDKIVNLISENERLKENNGNMQEEMARTWEENERLKVKTKEQSLLLIDYQDMEQRYNDYKSRCEKAISKINDLYSYADNEEYVDNYCKDLLNILQNGSDSQ